LVYHERPVTRVFRKKPPATEAAGDPAPLFPDPGYRGFLRPLHLGFAFDPAPIPPLCEAAS